MRKLCLDDTVAAVRLVTNPPPQAPCPTCAGWGETDANHPCTVYCPDCHRPTHPDLGVNLPAGAAVSLGTTHAVELSRRREGGVGGGVLYTRRRRARS